MNWRSIFKTKAPRPTTALTLSNGATPPEPVGPPANLLALEPEQIAARAKRISKVLGELVREGGFVRQIGGNDYVEVGGWNCMGTLMGFTIHTVDVREMDDGGFEAQVEIRSQLGTVLSSASARCGMDEKKWAKVEAFSRRSMAITRATGKAYRLQFSWIMRLAGFAETPAEDMPQYEPRRPREEQPPHPADQPNGTRVRYDPFRVRRNDGGKGTFNGQWPGRS